MFLLLLTGCGDHQPVATYAVDSESAPIVQQIEAAVVFADNQAWFFKLGGDPQIVREQREKLAEFLGSLSLGGEPELAYDLPTGWTVVAGTSAAPAGPGSETVAEIEVTNRPQPKLAISKFPTTFPTDDAELKQAQQDYLLENVNRWRRQVALPPLEATEVASVGESFTTKTGQSGHVFSMQGQVEAAGRQPPSPRQFGVDTENYTTPDGWTLVENTQFSTLHFTAGPNGNIDISLTDISVPGNTSGLEIVLSNVARWNRQLGLPQFDPANLANVSEPIQVDGHQCLIVNLISDGPVAGENYTDPVRILGAIVLADSSVWTVRIKGPADLVQVQRGKLDQFLNGLTFEQVRRQ